MKNISMTFLIWILFALAVANELYPLHGELPFQEQEEEIFAASPLGIRG